MYTNSHHARSLNSFLSEVARLYSEQRAIRIKRIVDRKRTYVTLYTTVLLYYVCGHSSSRLQPEKYRRLLGSATNRFTASLRTIDSDWSMREAVSGEDGDTGDGVSEEEEEEVRLNSVRSEEGTSGTVRHRLRGRQAGDTAGRESGESGTV